MLLLVFNRPDATELALQAIREARPPRLYVSADGPRNGRPDDAARCAEVRAIASRVDWPCQFRTLFRDGNLGCKLAVSSGIDWFFEHEEEGIILEDDIIPDASFFRYCDELLVRYRDDPIVASISGCNLVSGIHATQDSYFFSRYCHVWGWATWRRAWQHYDQGMANWPAWETSGELERRFSRPGSSAFWHETLRDVYAGRIDTWDVQWVFTCWQRGWLSVLPVRNLVRNIGFGAEATHTTGAMPTYVRDSRAAPMDFPIRHPIDVERCAAADDTIDRVVYGNANKPGWGGDLLRLARRLSRALTR